MHVWISRFNKIKTMTTTQCIPIKSPFLSKFCHLFVIRDRIQLLMKKFFKIHLSKKGKMTFYFCRSFSEYT